MWPGGLAGLLILLLSLPVYAAETWPSLHNGGNTSISARHLPMEWSPERGIAWSVVLPGYGQSALVVHGGRVYITAVAGAGTKAGHELVWKAEKAVCHYVSPLVHQSHAYYLNQPGVLFCLRAGSSPHAPVAGEPSIGIERRGTAVVGCVRCGPVRCSLTFVPNPAKT